MSIVNPRAKGLRVEAKAVALAKSEGWNIVRLYQPRGTHQPCDLILIGQRQVRFVEVKANQARSAAKMLRAWQLPHQATLIKELWVWKDRAERPKMRVIE